MKNEKIEKLHWLDELSADERRDADRQALERFRKNHPESNSKDCLYIEEQFMGEWQGTYRLGDWSHSSRYRFVGFV